MISAYVSRLVILVFGTLYPAYASYKAVRTKNVKEYVKWMMYWIVFALFSCAETFTDVFFSWFPFYYEIKIILVLWLLSPATKGSSILYRKFVHPTLSRREQEIDEYISKAKEQGYHTVLNLGTKGVNYATAVIMQTAIKGGGGLVNQLRKSYSLSDLSTDSGHPSDDRLRQNGRDEPDDVVETSEPRLRRPRGRAYSPHRSISGPNRVDMYFPEVDVDVRQSASTSSARGEPLAHIRSIEDVSSGYSSAEYVAHSVKPEGVVREGSLVRTASMGGASRVRAKTTRSSGLSTKKVATPTEDSSLLEESEEPEYDTQLISKSSIHVLRKQNALAFAPNVAMIEIIHQVEGSDEPVSTSSNDNDSSNDFDDPMDFPSEKNKSDKEVSCEKDELIIKQNVDNKDVKNDEISEISPETVDVNISYSNETSKAVDDNLDKNSEGSFVSIKSLTDTNNLPRSEQKESERAGKYNKLAAPLPPSQKKVDNVDKAAIVNDESDSGVNENESLTKKTPEKNSDEVETPSLDHKCETVSDSKPEIESKIEEDKGKPIKATLVLTPGILKSVEIPSDSSKKSKIFVSASPKAHRKKKTENQKTKKTPMSRLMMLPKKLTFWNHSSNKSDENATAILAETSSLLSEDQIRKLEIAIKRSSWHENSSSRSVTPESIDIKYSRSNEELTRIPANPRLTESFGHVSRRKDDSLDEMKLRELSQSPVRLRKHTEV